MFDKAFRIGTRDSQLALLQAHKVIDLLEASHLKTQLVAIKSAGDLNLSQPMYAMGIQGVFTKGLDIALLENRIDLAVHSLKDVPTQLPEGLTLGAVLERGSACDVLIRTQKSDLEEASTIATGSLRRKAQWLNKYDKMKQKKANGNQKEPKRSQKTAKSEQKGAQREPKGAKRYQNGAKMEPKSDQNT